MGNKGVTSGLLGAIVLLVLSSVVAFGQGTSTNVNPSAGSTAAVPPVLPPINTVFVIVFENKNYSGVIGNAAAPYINSLVPQGAVATQYFTPPGNHPSEPNYIWLEAGSNLGLTTDNDASLTNSTSTTDHLVTFL